MIHLVDRTPLFIGIDFDGTCVTHDYPKVGVDIGAVPILKKLVEKGHKLILYTMRGDEVMEDAKKWFADNGIKLYSANSNPTQSKWTNSNKIYCHIYIDDAALGVPLKYNKSLSNRPFVDWNGVEEILKHYKII